MSHAKWDARIRRARDLISDHPSAAEGLHFYDHVTQFQHELYAEIEAACGTAKEPRPHGSLRVELDLFVLLPRFGAFLSMIEKSAPAPLARSAGELRASDSSYWQRTLTD